MDCRLALIVALLAMGCAGASPAGPVAPGALSGGGLPFDGTRYSLYISGDSSKCGDVKSPQAGTSVTLTLTLQADATGWTATASSGTLALRLQKGTATVHIGLIPVTGSGTGVADDVGIPLQFLPAPPNGTRVTFGGTVPLSGEMPNSVFALGTFDGPMVFSRNGVTSTCPAGAVDWTLNIFRG